MPLLDLQDVDLGLEHRQQVLEALQHVLDLEDLLLLLELQRQMSGNGIGEAPPSSMPESDVRISGGIFLFSFTYWSNCVSSVRRIASISFCALPSVTIGSPRRRSASLRR
jgi:hypothetical protein